MASEPLAPSYLEVHRYDGAAIERPARNQLVPCAVQPRDLKVLRDVWRYKFLTAPQLLELWWPGGVGWPGQRRLLKLFAAGYLERFRPVARRGSYPWTYHLGERGHRLLQDVGVIAQGQRYRRREIYDFGHVLHELQLNAWVLALRRAVGNGLVAWDGEHDIDPPPQARRSQQLLLEDDWSIEGLRDPRPRLLRPDAAIKIAASDGDEAHTLLVEYDRTRRLDKNYDKFRRYDTFLCWWWRHTAYANHPTPPFVVFVCQDASQRNQFLAAADRELTGHRWHPSADPQRHEHTGRHQILFAIEHDAHAGTLEAWQLPPFPPRHPVRQPQVGRLDLASPPDGHRRAR
jgi:hypothetical protein